MSATPAITIERASLRDAGEIAALYLASRAAALPWLRRVHSDDEVRGWIAHVRLATGETWVAREAGRILGFLCLDGEDLDQLYLLPGQFRRGIGSLLLVKAKERSPERLHLFTFQRNAAARAFYERHGFRLVDLNDGERNEEGEPDALYEWRRSFSDKTL
ncbi:GNAT family N-acetyltransferase [Bosea sp. ANAM02]|uniref:GNAT family N-acetyltransferase n=1 Tax=Bosea sp. ANAM02 TaxID=2020412 RepID=UPI00140F3800|nr:GNAT family N-acetyltransferase [Bosea sp. ANAM02]BCB21086.1 histone acetyltransferase [Bosea sp. ANAM02]